MRDLEEMKPGDTASIMTCDGCGFTDDAFQPNITAEEMQNDTAAALMSVKKYFEDQGWRVSLGYDLCPNCVNMEQTSN